MTPLNSRTCPARGVVWAGFMLLVLSLLVSVPASSGETAGNRDEPSPSSTTSLSPSDTVEITPTASLSPTFPPSSTPGPTLSPAATNPPSSSPAITAETPVEPSSTSQPTTSPTISLTPSPTNVPVVPTDAATFQPSSILISEVAWAGTLASAHDEWVELYNPGEESINLGGWVLTDNADIHVRLGMIVAPYSFVLLERTDDSTVANIPADQIYSGSLRNSGDTLFLLDPAGIIIDSANAAGGAWPARDNSTKATMERRGGDDRSGNWGTFTGFHGVGVDAAGNHIQGTPRQINSIFFPTPEPTWIPGKLVINEVLMRPHYDWEGIGGVDTGDEFVELLNLGPLPVNLRGWLLNDISGAGSKPYKLPSKTLAPGEFVSFFRSRTGIALNDGGDSARLLAPDGRLVDRLTYLRVRAYNLSYGRLPDGSGKLAYGLWPTPGKANLLFVEPLTENHSAIVLQCRQSSGFTLALARFIRHPMTMSRLSSSGYRLCWIRD